MLDALSSRRAFLARAPLAAILAAAAAACAKQAAAAAFATLGVEEARELEAIAARIFPATDTPGAREAGVVHYFDAVFATFHAGDLDFARAGLAELQAGLPEGTSFSTLPEAEQDARLREIENGGFFQLIRYMTICGVFGMSAYGGNKDGAGHRLLGLASHVHAFVPPFGYYDAEHMGVPFEEEAHRG